MRLVLLCLCLTAMASNVHAQYVYTINADSVKITNHCDSAELIIENHTQGVQGGFLYNTGNGRTIFKKALQRINDTIYLIGTDTLKLVSGSGNTAWLLNGNTGTSPYTNFIGTTDGQPLVFAQTNNPLNTFYKLGWLDYGNLVLGSNAGANIYTSGGSYVGNSNILVGAGAGRSITSTYGSVIIGFHDDEFDSTSAGNDVLIGQGVANQKNGGYGNVFIGQASGQSAIDGDQNVLIGQGGGASVIHGNRNIIIGASTGSPAGDLDGQLVIGQAIMGSDGQGDENGNVLGIFQQNPQYALDVNGVINTNAGYKANAIPVPGSDSLAWNFVPDTSFWDLKDTSHATAMGTTEMQWSANQGTQYFKTWGNLSGYQSNMAITDQGPWYIDHTTNAGMPVTNAYGTYIPNVIDEFQDTVSWSVYRLGPSGYESIILGGADPIQSNSQGYNMSLVSYDPATGNLQSFIIDTKNDQNAYSTYQIQGPSYYAETNVSAGVSTAAPFIDNTVQNSSGLIHEYLTSPASGGYWEIGTSGNQQDHPAIAVATVASGGSAWFAGPMAIQSIPNDPNPSGDSVLRESNGNIYKSALPAPSLDQVLATGDTTSRFMSFNNATSPTIYVNSTSTDHGSSIGSNLITVKGLTNNNSAGASLLYQNLSGNGYDLDGVDHGTLLFTSANDYAMLIQPCLSFDYKPVNLSISALTHIYMEDKNDTIAMRCDTASTDPRNFATQWDLTHKRANPSYTIFTPSSGGTLTTLDNEMNIINPSTALSALTINLPSSPSDGDVVEVKFDQAISSITYSNGTVLGGLATAVTGSYLKFTYNSATSTWY